MKVTASAPSNIALIKYMGKTGQGQNQPTNSSFSYTLEGLRTFVELEPISGDSDRWELLTGTGLLPFEMGEKGRTRFLNHLGFLKKTWGIEENFCVRSASNFPSDCGLASSASSFAALTMAASQVAEGKGIEIPDPFELARLSQVGSGSSCRSFLGPWVLWSSTGVRPLEFPMGRLQHAVIVVEDKRKRVSSSEAHQRVSTSPLFHRRPERAEERLAQLLMFLRNQDWAQAFEITWAEFWDMHALFETSKPSFGYFEPGTIEVLHALRDQWTAEHDGPLVTMDAGANIHLLYREEQSDLKKQFLNRWQNRFRIFDSETAVLP